MIPKGLEHHHFMAAIREIDARGAPSRRASHRYDLVLGGKAYPPKYLISIATRIATGSEWDPKKFNAVEAKSFFRTRGFTISTRDGKTARVQSRIAHENTESRFAEGKEMYRMHRELERDSLIAKKAKKLRLSQQQDLRCDVCDFSFFELYGKTGEGYIEAHHTIPVSELHGVTKTKLSDIALVCSNCHRMLHRSKPMFSIVALRSIVRKNRKP